MPGIWSCHIVISVGGFSAVMWTKPWLQGQGQGQAQSRPLRPGPRTQGLCLRAKSVPDIVWVQVPSSFLSVPLLLPPLVPFSSVFRTAKRSLKSSLDPAVAYVRCTVLCVCVTGRAGNSRRSSSGNTGWSATRTGSSTRGTGPRPRYRRWRDPRCSPRTSLFTWTIISSHRWDSIYLTHIVAVASFIPPPPGLIWSVVMMMVMMMIDYSFIAKLSRRSCSCKRK